MNFDINTEQLAPDAYVISLTGEVDLYTAPEFKQQLLDVIGQGARAVVVDFSNTTFIDSTTLGVLVGGVKRLRTNDGELSLVCSDRNITKIFEITGLDRVFTIHATREEAVAQLGSGKPRLALRRAAAPASAPALVAAASSPRAAAPVGLSGAVEPRPRTARSCSSRSAAAATRSPTPGRRARSGPNLDAAFEYDRKQGFDESSFVPLVRDQIAYAISEPVGIVVPPTKRGEEKTAEGNPTRAPGMPKNLVRGRTPTTSRRTSPRSPASRRRAAARRARPRPRHRRRLHPPAAGRRAARSCVGKSSSRRPAAAAATRSRTRARRAPSGRTSTRRSRPRRWSWTG